MKQKFAVLLVIICSSYFSQNDSLVLKPGDHAPSFILNVAENSIQSFSMPHMKRIVLLHFWSSSVHNSKLSNKHLSRLVDRYKNAIYSTARGFEVIAVCVQTDKKTWAESIERDSLSNFTHGI